MAASSGITNSVEKIVELEQAGIGAVVLKSIFEEQINGEVTSMLEKMPKIQVIPRLKITLRIICAKTQLQNISV